MFSLTGFLSFIFVAVAILLTLVVLVQRGRGGGLSGAFGSGGGSSSAFGTKTGDVFTWATVILFAVFMLLAIWLNLRFPAVKEDYGSSVIRPEPAKPEPGATGNLNVQPSATSPAPAATIPAPAPVVPVVPVAPAAPATAPAASTSQPK